MRRMPRPVTRPMKPPAVREVSEASCTRLREGEGRTFGAGDGRAAVGGGRLEEKRSVTACSGCEGVG